VFQSDFVRALSKADRVVLPAVFRATLPDDVRLSPEQVVEELSTAGVHARYVPAVDDIVRVVAKESRPGDLVVIMSNGGFDNIHQKLLTALEAKRSR
jgi:UDP-N-acetylmuramate: L-alanyl-gamma-D-glutamyl-meso-diaminopimelate ligase